MPNWPNNPLHRLSSAAAFLVTTATQHEAPLFRGELRLDFLQNTLVELAQQFGWELQAWTIVPNHYHFIAISPAPQTLHALVEQFHAVTARYLKQQDNSLGPRIWSPAGERFLSHENTYLSRLKDVHFNPVQHGLVRDAARYPWCSAPWFARKADRFFYQAIKNYPADGQKMVDFPCKTWK